jgi:hypothetical protein
MAGLSGVATSGCEFWVKEESQNEKLHRFMTGGVLFTESSLIHY